LQITVLGCWSPYPRAGGACPGYLVDLTGYRLLLECGNGSFSRLQELMDFRSLDGVVISHFHEDHAADLFCLRHAIMGSIIMGTRSQPLEIWAPEKPTSALEPLMRQPEFLTLRPLGQGMVQDQFTGRVLQTKHPLLTYALRLEEKTTGQVFAYSADTQWQDELVSFIQGADIFLCEAGFQEHDQIRRQVGGHLTSRQAGQIAKAAGVKKLVLTHFFPEYDLEVSRREAEEAFGSRVELATEGQVIRCES
jgi:ribonuclease BN (tRNA processing enzyme)